MPRSPACGPCSQSAAKAEPHRTAHSGRRAGLWKGQAVDSAQSSLHRREYAADSGKRSSSRAEFAVCSGKRSSPRPELAGDSEEYSDHSAELAVDSEEDLNYSAELAVYSGEYLNHSEEYPGHSAELAADSGRSSDPSMEGAAYSARRSRTEGFQAASRPSTTCHPIRGWHLGGHRPARGPTPSASARPAPPADLSAAREAVLRLRGLRPRLARGCATDGWRSRRRRRRWRL
jgi:hypothetical protein